PLGGKAGDGWLSTSMCRMEGPNRTLATERTLHSRSRGIVDSVGEERTGPNGTSILSPVTPSASGRRPWKRCAASGKVGCRLGVGVGPPGPRGFGVNNSYTYGRSTPGRGGVEMGRAVRGLQAGGRRSGSAVQTGGAFLGAG